jgi:hypothetical protein
MVRRRRCAPVVVGDNVSEAPGDGRVHDRMQRDAGKTRGCSRLSFSSWSGKEAGLEDLRASVTFGHQWSGQLAAQRADQRT